MSDSAFTKRAIADSVKELTKTKSFDKIGVVDITEKCGINRQTFYYHFSDKYELLKWIYYNDYFAANLSDLSFSNWNEKLTNTLIAMRNDRDFCINTINHTDDYLKTFLVDYAENVFSQAIEVLDEKGEIEPEPAKYFSRFFAYGLSGIIIEWMTKQDMEIEPEKISGYLNELMKACENAAHNENVTKLLHNY